MGIWRTPRKSRQHVHMSIQYLTNCQHKFKSARISRQLSKHVQAILYPLHGCIVQWPHLGPKLPRGVGKQTPWDRTGPLNQTMRRQNKNTTVKLNTYHPLCSIMCLVGLVCTLSLWGCRGAIFMYVQGSWMYLDGLWVCRRMFYVFRSISSKTEPRRAQVALVWPALT